jgi:peroxiredoxin Q/BCP
MCFACNSTGTQTAATEPANGSEPSEDPGQIHADPDESRLYGGQPKLQRGMTAPDVDMMLQNGKRLKLSELRPKRVVLFFYPMDDTPGCRAEAQGFRDHFAEFKERDSVVLGVSLQGPESHRKFIEKERLPFDLVVDDKAEMSEAFGVPIRGQATARQTFLIDGNGAVAEVWRQVAPREHAAEVLASLDGD